MSDNEEVWFHWKVGSVAALIIGAPLYIGLYLPEALLVHAGLIVLYVLALKAYGKGHIIEAAVVVFIFSGCIAVNVPAFRQAMEAKHRHDQRKLERRRAIEGKSNPNSGNQ